MGDDALAAVGMTTECKKVIAAVRDQPQEESDLRIALRDILGADFPDGLSIEPEPRGRH